MFLRFIPQLLNCLKNSSIVCMQAFGKYSEGLVLDMLDPQIKEAIDREILMKMFALAIHCAAPTRVDRPDMKLVGEELWAVRMDYLKSGRRG